MPPDQWKNIQEGKELIVLSYFVRRDGAGDYFGENGHDRLGNFGIGKLGNFGVTTKRKRQPRLTLQSISNRTIPKFKIK
jgi:hypothetical protein